MDRRFSLALFFVLLSSAALFAQDDSSEISPNTYGTSAEIVQVIGPADLDPMNSSVTYGYFNAGRFATAGSSGFQATLQLPAGSVVSRFELDACDNSSTGEVSAWVLRCVSPFNACFIIASRSTGLGFSDGGACGTFEGVLPTPEVIDNEANVYLVQAQNSGNFTQSTRISSIRVYYKLQVSTAPGTATFSDVPVGHPFHRFVEALVAAGITAGCGGGNFCPGDPVTRGQMAVFLSAALGLHWTP